jgi:hypothetical protein
MPTLWARLREDVDCGLRRGAWYQTVARGWTEVVLDVHGQRRSLPLRSLEIAATRPNHWTIVARARNSAVIPERWSRGYAVCPCCSYRQLPMGRPGRLRCDGCHDVFDVAWDQPYLRAVADSN